MIDSRVPGLPPEFLERLQAIVAADDLPGVLDSFAAPAATTFRVNSLKAVEARVLAELADVGIEAQRLPVSIPAFRVPGAQRRRFTETEAVTHGRAYLQNPSSMFPPLVLEPGPGHEVLDLAAAPGGKTLHLAALMGNQGRIGAVEAVKSRFFKLRENLKRGGASISRAYLRDGTRVWRKTPERFDRVLLDAPCSSEARFRADDPQSAGYWGPRKIREMRRKQERLLYSAIQCLKPGGVLVYCTCSFAPEENEQVVDRLLARFPEQLQIEAISLDIPNRRNGLTSWHGKSYGAELAKAVRILPDDVMSGFFICRLRKTASTLKVREYGSATPADIGIVRAHDDVAPIKPSLRKGAR